MGKLTLKYGKFWLDGKEAPPQIGNTEQIALLKAEEKRLKDLEENGISVNFNLDSVEFDVSFNCLCGYEIKSHFTDNFPNCNFYDENDMSVFIDGTHYTCPFCNRKYYYDECDEKVKSL